MKLRKKSEDDMKASGPVVVGGPFNVQHKVHVDFEFSWSGQDPGDIFEFVEKLGEGAFGAVHKAVHKASGFLLAIKVLAIGDPNSEVNKDIRKEIDILRKCKSPHIVSYFGTALQKAPDDTHDLWIMMDYCGKGSVRDIICRLERPLTEREVAEVMQGTLLGLAYLHSLGITHRDVKAANILLTEKGQVKIADFGVSQQLTGTVGGGDTLTGTPLWMAPEVVQRRITPEHVNKSDIWSLGITAIECADGWPPHADLKPMRAMMGIPVRPPPTLADPRKWSKEFNSFIASTLIKDPSKRPSAVELLQHPFITKNARNVDPLKDLLAASPKGVWQRFLPDFLQRGGQQTVSDGPTGPAPPAPARPKRVSATCPPSPGPTGDLGTAVINDTSDVRTMATPLYLRNRGVKATADDDGDDDDGGNYEFSDTVAVKTVVTPAASAKQVPTAAAAAPPAGKRKKEDSGPLNTKRNAIYIPTFLARSVSLFRGNASAPAGDGPTTTTPSYAMALSAKGDGPAVAAGAAAQPYGPGKASEKGGPLLQNGGLVGPVGLPGWRMQRRLSRYLPNDRSVITYSMVVVLFLSLLLNVYLLFWADRGASPPSSASAYYRPAGRAEQADALHQLGKLVDWLTSSLGRHK